MGNLTTIAMVKEIGFTPEYHPNFFLFIFWRQFNVHARTKGGFTSGIYFLGLRIAKQDGFIFYNLFFVSYFSQQVKGGK